MSKISNVITFMQYLSTGKKYSIQELSEQLEASPRMISVYKEELENLLEMRPMKDYSKQNNPRSLNLKEKQEQKETVEKGILYCSGLIAGEGVIGMILAIFAIIPVANGTLADAINLNYPLGQIGSVIFFIGIIVSILYFSFAKNKNKSE